MWYGYHDEGPWGRLAMVVMMALFWVPLIVAVAWLVGWTRRSDHGGPPSRTPGEDDPLEIARRAYARGDLPRARYLQIVEDLRGTADPRGGG